jgi:hypothetical protein
VFVQVSLVSSVPPAQAGHSDGCAVDSFAEGLKIPADQSASKKYFFARKMKKDFHGACRIKIDDSGSFASKNGMPPTVHFV